MALGITLEASITKFGSKGGTRTRQLAKVLREGYDVDDKLTRIKVGQSAPARCILALRSRSDKKVRHWVLQWDYILYDPSCGVNPCYDEDIFFSSYLELKPKIVSG